MNEVVIQDGAPFVAILFPLEGAPRLVASDDAHDLAICTRIHDDLNAEWKSTFARACELIMEQLKA